MKTYLKKNKSIIFPLIIFYIISILAINSFSIFLPSSYGNLALKQTINYLLGILILLIIYKIGIKKILKYSFLIYSINVLLLLALLFFAQSINGIKAWFVIPYLGNIQPSEFMKIGIVLMGVKIINNSSIKGFKNELKLIIKLFIIVLIPSILTFLEPDTGAVIIYLIIFITLLFLSGIRLRWFVLFGTIIIIILGIILYLFFFQSDLFIKIIGNSFFYRLDRILDWNSTQGMQLENSIIAIASSGLFGHGYKNIPIYYPEGHTDFIFTSFASSFGLIGIILLLGTIIYFDYNLFILAKKQKNKTNQYIITSFLVVILYQQVQNISMTFGILPITGITLPFISYGGSSLLSFFACLGIIINIQNNKKNKFN